MTETLRRPDWLHDAELAVSLYAADFSRLGDQVTSLLDAGARLFHFDVGDGHFIPDITVGPIVLKSIAQMIHDRNARVGCHLMVESPELQLDHFKSAGADSITFHLEACQSPKAVILRARELGLRVGVALKPETPPANVVDIAQDVDFILSMNIHPGLSGQPILPNALDRVRELRKLLPDTFIEVDGGVHHGNIHAIRMAGANLVVVGSAIFWTDDPVAAFRRLRIEIGRANQAA